MALTYVVLVLSLGPFALALLNLCLYRTPQAAAGELCVSVLIPARNEAANIADARGLITFATCAGRLLARRRPCGDPCLTA